MQVLTSSVDLYGDFKMKESKTVQERLTTWTDGRRTEANVSADSPAISLNLSEEALTRLRSETAASEDMSGETIYELKPKEKQIIALLEKFISALTGKDCKIIVPEKLCLTDSSGTPGASAQLTAGPAGSRQGWGLDYHYEETYTEKETMTFAAQGKITTDGGEIEFKLNLQVSRQHSYSQTIDIKAGTP
jgi:hypothetical protein